MDNEALGNVLSKKLSPFYVYIQSTIICIHCIPSVTEVHINITAAENKISCFIFDIVDHFSASNSMNISLKSVKSVFLFQPSYLVLFLCYGICM